MEKGLLNSKTFHLSTMFVLLLTIGALTLPCFRQSLRSASAVTSYGNIGVYWNENCRSRVNSIEWGDLSPGETKKVAVYVRNEGNGLFLLVLQAKNWNPQSAPRYLYFSWSCEDDIIKMGKVVKVFPILSVSFSVKGISVFSFDIVFKVGKVPDVNNDNYVGSDDIILVAQHFGEAEEKYDINADGYVGVEDIFITAEHFGTDLSDAS